jgi:hypothetical protein
MLPWQTASNSPSAIGFESAMGIDCESAMGIDFESAIGIDFESAMAFGIQCRFVLGSDLGMASASCTSRARSTQAGQCNPTGRSQLGRQCWGKARRRRSAQMRGYLPIDRQIPEITRRSSAG